MTNKKKCLLFGKSEISTFKFVYSLNVKWPVGLVIIGPERYTRGRSIPIQDKC